VRQNRLRELLDGGRPSLGTHLSISWPAITELVGHARAFDYVEFVAEYTPYDLYSLENLGRAIDLFPHLTGMMKIEQHSRSYLATRAIGSGIQNLLFADVRTVDDVRECVRAVRAETPGRDGLHGVGMRRDVGYVLEGGSPAFVEALDRAVIALMIEKRQAVENLDAILAVPGIDMIQFGPSDYAMSTGKTGDWNHPEVREVERHVIQAALARGLAPRAEISHPRGAERYLEMGVKHFCMGWDMSILHDWFTQTGGAMRELLSEKAEARTPPAHSLRGGSERGGAR
jgi:4-hydroxy-2-oxoheptanedioate aldolase